MPFWGLIIPIIAIVIFYIKRESDEELLVLKLIGYYILGVFYFNFNGIVIPLGFIISLFLKPQENKGIKRGIAIFGLITMILGFFIR